MRMSTAAVEENRPSVSFWEMEEDSRKIYYIKCCDENERNGDSWFSLEMQN